MLMEFTSANIANSCLMHDILNIEVNYYLKDLPNLIQIHFKLGLCKCVVKFPPQFHCTTALNEVLILKQSLIPTCLMIMFGMLNNVNTHKLKYYNDYEYNYNRRIKFVLFLLLLLFRYPASTGLCPARLMLLMRNENYYISAVGWVLHHFFPAQSVQDI